jgi:uncharacterized membrane protein (DUF485 family)
MSEEVYGRIYDNPKFQELTRRRSRFAWTLSAIVLTVYYSFILVVGFVPEILGTPLGEGKTLTIGVPVGAAIIVFAWLTTGIYMRRANNEFDAINEEILEEAK